ncbi:MAG: peptidylprolyl isomerase [Anaerolineae bacterium]
MSKRTQIPKELTRKQISRRDREAVLRRRLLLGVAGVLALVLVIAAWGLYDQFVVQPRQPVAVVSGVPIRQDTYQKLVRFRRWDYRSYLSQLEAQAQQYAAGGEEQSFMLQYINQQIQQLESELNNVPMSVLDELIEDQVVRQEATRRGITVSPEEVQTQIEEEFGYWRNPPTPEPTAPVALETPEEADPTAEPTAAATEDVTPIAEATAAEPTEIPVDTPTPGPTPTPNPTPTPMTYEGFVEQSELWYQTLKGATGLTQQDFAWLVESGMYRQRLSEAMGAETPTTEEQVHARHILVETREEAEAVLARLAEGEEFAPLAAELSVDTSTKDQGGDLGWFGRGVMDSAFEEAVFALQPGETSDIVESSFGFHIIRLDERDANHPMDPDRLANAQSEAFSAWLQEQTALPSVERHWNANMVPKDIVATAR